MKAQGREGGIVDLRGTTSLLGAESDAVKIVVLGTSCEASHGMGSGNVSRGDSSD